MNENSWYKSVVIYLMVELRKRANMSQPASRIRFVDIHIFHVLFFWKFLCLFVADPTYVNGQYMLPSVMRNEILYKLRKKLQNYLF